MTSLFKKSIFLLAGVMCILPLHSAVAEISSVGVAPPEAIENFNTTIQVESGGRLQVTERIQYLFEGQKHGIIRYIPIKYINTDYLKSNYTVRLKVISVTDEQGSPYLYKTSYSDDILEIKIGDPDTYVEGKKTYVITYDIDRAFSFLSDHDELYWNVTGNKWNVPIKSAAAEVRLPLRASSEKIKQTCYTGKFGSTEQACQGTISDSSVTFKITQELGVQAGLTIVVGVPKGIIAPPSSLQKSIWFITDNWPLALPFITFIIMFTLWYRKGRDPKGKGVVIAQYEPPRGLSPIELGTINNERVNKRDIASIIIDLAVKGFLKIKYLPKTFSKDYEFIKLKEAKDISNSSEQKMFVGIFGTKERKKLSELKNKFLTTVSDITKDVYASVTNQGYFVKNPAKTRLLYSIISIVICAGGALFFGPILFDLTGVSTSSSVIVYNEVAVILSGVIVGTFGWFMPRKTPLGAVVKEEIQGFKLFLSVTEEERLKFHNAPAKKPELFEKYLPYAMVLGVEKEWAKQFEGIFTEPPGWYEGNWATFSLVNFTSNLSSFSSTASSSMMSTPSSGGGGFSGGSSGGGFGGGGGSSW